MPLLAIASAVSRTTFSLSPLQANLFQLFHPMGGVLARPLSSASPEETAIAKNMITNNIRTAEKPKRIVLIPFHIAKCTEFCSRAFYLVPLRTPPHPGVLGKVLAFSSLRALDWAKYS